MQGQARVTIVNGAQLTSIGISVLLLLGTVPGVASAQETQQCKDVEIIVTAGTGGSAIDDDPHTIESIGVGTNFAANLTKEFPAVSAWQTPYNASVGVAGTTGHMREKRVMPYGQSRDNGVERVLQRMADVTEACPGTRFIVAGFSQGADVSGDVAHRISIGDAPIAPESLLAAYLVADPGRTRLTESEATTDNGTKGRLTADGGVLLYSSATLPPAHTVGLSGARPDGAFKNLPGKVRHICAGDDPACVVDPQGLLATTGAWANDQNGAQYEGPIASLSSMLFDGSLLRALGPHAAAILSSLISENFDAVDELFTEATLTPGLTEPQIAALRLFGNELTSVCRHLESLEVLEIPDFQHTGNATVDRIVNIYMATHRELGYAAVMPRNHSVYAGGNRDYVLTIEGSRADDWIQADMFNVIARETGDPRRATPLPYAKRNTPWHHFGHWQWNALQWGLGPDHPWARQLWEFYGL